MLNTIPNTDLSKELSRLRMQLDSLLNEKTIALLLEAERRIAGEIHVASKKKKTAKELRNEAYTKFLLKGL